MKSFLFPTAFLLVLAIVNNRAGADPTIIASNPYAGIGAPAVYNQPINGIPGPWAQQLAVPFSTGATAWSLDSVSIYLQDASGNPGDLSVGIYDSGSNLPGTGYGISYAPTTELAALSSTTPVSVLASYSFLPSGNVDLAADTTYWLTLTPSLAEPSEFYWFRGTSVGIEGQSLANINTGYAWSTWDISTDTNQSLNFVVNGTVKSSQTSVPEGGATIAMLGFSLTSLAMLRRRLGQ